MSYRKLYENDDIFIAADDYNNGFIILKPILESATIDASEYFDDIFPLICSMNTASICVDYPAVFTSPRYVSGVFFKRPWTFDYTEQIVGPGDGALDFKGVFPAGNLTIAFSKANKTISVAGQLNAVAS